MVQGLPRLYGDEKKLGRITMYFKRCYLAVGQEMLSGGSIEQYRLNIPTTAL